MSVFNCFVHGPFMYTQYFFNQGSSEWNLPWLTGAMFHSMACCSETFTFEFFHNAQSWQCWNSRTISNGNKLEVVTNRINFTANLHLSWCIKIEVTDNYIHLIFEVMPTLPTLCIAGKFNSWPACSSLFHFPLNTA